MSIDQETIDTLYPDAKTEADEINPGDSTEPDDAVAAMYPEEPEKPEGNPYALEEDKGVTDNLYGANEKVELASDDDLTLIASTEEEATQLKSNLGHIASLTGATQQDVSSLIETCNEHLLTNESYNETDTMKTLYSQHGGELSAKLQAAQTLVQSFPDLAEWMDSTGAGNNPKIINQMMKIAESPRSQERINKLIMRSKK